MRYAIVTNGIVTNTIEAEADYAASIGAMPAANAGIGWLYADGVFTAPPAPAPMVPQSVTMRQARLALLGAGLLPSVNAAIAAMPEPDKSAAQITWEFAATVDRSFGMVPQLAAALGMTEAQIDDLFVAASQL